MPKRIQRKRTKGWRSPKGCIYCGRPSKYANPFDWQELGRECALDKFRVYLERWERCLPLDFAKALTELRGHDLSCWCKLTEVCHVDIWLEKANG